jgi:hypothetical protein
LYLHQKYAYDLYFIILFEITLCMEIRRDRGSSAATRKIHRHQLETMNVGSLLPFHLDPFTSLERFHEKHLWLQHGFLWEPPHRRHPLPQHLKNKVRTYRGRYHDYPSHCSSALFSVLLKSLCDPIPMRPRNDSPKELDECVMYTLTLEWITWEVHTYNHKNTYT